MWWLWLIVLIRLRQSPMHFPIGHTRMHCMLSQGIRSSLGSLQRNWDSTQRTYGVNVTVPWEPVLDEPTMNLDPGIGVISVSSWEESLIHGRSHYCGYWPMEAFIQVPKKGLWCEIHFILWNLGYCFVMSISDFKEASASYSGNWSTLTIEWTQSPDKVIHSDGHFSLLVCW